MIRPPAVDFLPRCTALIKGESVLSGLSDEGYLVAPSARSPAALLRGRGGAGVGSWMADVEKSRGEQKNALVSMMSSLVSNLCLCRPTVLQNFSRKSRNTVSVREGQAVVLLCGPPPHYGGTVLIYSPAFLSTLHRSSFCFFLLSSFGSAAVLLCFSNNLTPLMECFTTPGELLHMSIWKTAHRKCLERVEVSSEKNWKVSRCLTKPVMTG